MWNLAAAVVMMSRGSGLQLAKCKSRSLSALPCVCLCGSPALEKVRAIPLVFLHCLHNTFNLARNWSVVTAHIHNNDQQDTVQIIMLICVRSIYQFRLIPPHMLHTHMSTVGARLESVLPGSIYNRRRSAHWSCHSDSCHSRAVWRKPIPMVPAQMNINGTAASHYEPTKQVTRTTARSLRVSITFCTYASHVQVELRRRGARS